MEFWKWSCHVLIGARGLTFCEIEFLDRAIRANGKHVRPHLLNVTSNTSGSIHSPRILMEANPDSSLEMALFGEDRAELMQSEQYKYRGLLAEGYGPAPPLLYSDGASTSN